MKKPEKLATKFATDLETNGCIGIAFVAHKESDNGSFACKADNGLDAIVLLAHCIENVAKASKTSPWHVMEMLGYLLGRHCPPENITPPLKEFADISRGLYEHRSH